MDRWIIVIILAALVVGWWSGIIPLPV